MTVQELIVELQKIDGQSRVFLGYDGNVVVTESSAVEYIASEQQTGKCWWGVKRGDTVILGAD